MLEFSDIFFSFPKAPPLLNGLSAQVKGGELCALLGVNGAGKSTLINILSGFMKAGRGTVSIGGLNAAEAAPKELAKVRAVLEQESELSFNYGVLETVMLGRYAFSNGFSAAREDELIARECLEKVSLAAFEKRLYPTLSGGEKRRAQLARVLAQIHSPGGDLRGKALLLDEPCAGLDPAHAHLAIRIAREAADKGAAVLCVLHDPNLAAQYADKIAILKDAKFFAFDSPEKIMTSEILGAAYRTPCRIIDGGAHPIALFDGE